MDESQTLGSKIELKAQGGIHVLSSYDIVGDIAVFRMLKSSQNEARLIAEYLATS